MTEETKKPRTRKSKSPAVEVQEPEPQPTTEVAVEVEVPTRKHNAYIHFQSIQRTKLLAENPSLGMTEISKLTSPLWKALTDEERAEWKRKAEALPGIPIKPKIVKEKKKGKRDPDAPKRKPTSFNNYFRVTGKAVREAYPDIPHTQILGKVTENWKKLTKEEQDSYKDM